MAIGIDDRDDEDQPQTREEMEREILRLEQGTPDEDDLPDPEEMASDDTVTAKMPTAAELDWPALWSEHNIDNGYPLSRTQLSLAVQATEQTPPAVSVKHANRLVDTAVDDGLLTALENRRYVYQEALSDE